MKVRELIEKLQAMPQEAEAFYVNDAAWDGLGGISDVRAVPCTTGISSEKVQAVCLALGETDLIDCSWDSLYWKNT